MRAAFSMSLSLLLLTALRAGGARAPATRGAAAAPARHRPVRRCRRCRSCSADVLAFSPQYPLWSDGATKRRWIWLPPGTSIDATRPDAWDFPRGTKLWKEFSHGRALETRFIERGADGNWRFAQLRVDRRWQDARARARRPAFARLPAPIAPGRALLDSRARTIAAPATRARRCRCSASARCSSRPTAIRWRRTPTTRRGIRSADAGGARPAGAISRRTCWRSRRASRRRSPAERAALGYLHGNCGNCHNDEGPLAVLEMTLAQRVAAPAGCRAALASSACRASSARRARRRTPRASRPVDLGASVIALRMRSRDPLQQMPPLGTRPSTPRRLTLIARWIERFVSPTQ